MIADDQPNKLQIAASFYSKLYEKEIQSETSLRAREGVLHYLLTAVTDMQNLDLGGVVTLQEAEEAIEKLPLRKTPGIDGMPTEFLKEWKAELAPDFHAAIQETFSTGELTESLNAGLITLIPKGGDPTQISNYRPITLLGLLYKLAAKILARRLQKISPAWSDPTRPASCRAKVSLTTSS